MRAKPPSHLVSVFGVEGNDISGSMSTKRKRRRHVGEGASILPPGKSARIEGVRIHKDVLSNNSVKFSKQCLKDMIMSQDVRKEIRFVRKDGVETMSACLQAFLQDLVLCIWREAQSRQRKYVEDKVDDVGHKPLANGRTKMRLTVQHFEAVLNNNSFFAFLNDILQNAQAEDKVIIVDDENGFNNSKISIGRHATTVEVESTGAAAMQQRGRKKEYGHIWPDHGGPGHEIGQHSSAAEAGPRTLVVCLTTEEGLSVRGRGGDLSAVTVSSFGGAVLRWCQSIYSNRKEGKQKILLNDYR